MEGSTRTTRYAGVACVLALVGCGGAVTVHAPVVQPARMPVRAFPHIIVVGDENPEAQEIAETLATHLSGGRSEVHRVHAQELENWRTHGGLPRASVVLRVSLRFVRGTQPGLGRTGFGGTGFGGAGFGGAGFGGAGFGGIGPMGCMPGTCPGSQRLYAQNLTVITAQLVITVVEGRGGRTLQREELTEDEEGMDFLDMRSRMVERLAARTVELLDQRTERVPVALLPSEQVAVREALAAIRDGEWQEGRQLLEAFVESDDFEALPDGSRALVWYDLGQARRFDTSLPADQRFSLAAEALREAIHLRPEPRYAGALGDLNAHRRSRAMVREQQEAMAHNFAIVTGGRARNVPEPPPSYRN